MRAIQTSDQRTPAEVLEDHLGLIERGEMERDLERNYSEEVLLLTPWGTLHGREGVRRARARLGGQGPVHKAPLRVQRLRRGLARLERVGEMNSETYLIHDGRIHLVVVDSLQQNELLR